MTITNIKPKEEKSKASVFKKIVPESIQKKINENPAVQNIKNMTQEMREVK